MKKKIQGGAAVDYPAKGEVVRPGHYAIRLTGNSCDDIQIRINGGEWMSCRRSVGYFWHDWYPRKGSVRIEVRSRVGQSRWSPSSTRSCVVDG